MRRLKRVLKIDKQAMTVEVEGGISIEDLNERLFKDGLALKNMGDANPQTIAGAVSTETHGSGASVGSLSEMVEGMTIVRADGELHDLQGDELKAGRVSLGKLGAVYSLTLSLRERFYLHHKQKLIKFADEQPLLDGLLQRRHLEYWYYPYTGMAERITREELPTPAVANPLNIFDEWFIKASSDLIEATGIHHPERLPGIFRASVKSDNVGVVRGLA
jgi:L-gulonolactone oxidase